MMSEVANKVEKTEIEKEQSDPFVINGDGSLGDFLKYLEAVGIKGNNKAFFGALKNQISAYNFTCSGGGKIWKLSSKLRK